MLGLKLTHVSKRGHCHKSCKEQSVASEKKLHTHQSLEPPMHGSWPKVQCRLVVPTFIFRLNNHKSDNQLIGGYISYHNCHCINSLTPGRFELNFRSVNFKPVLVIDGWGIYCEIATRWLPLDLTDDKSTLFQVMAWCCQATSHYLSQCWHGYMWPYGITRPYELIRSSSLCFTSNSQ